MNRLGPLTRSSYVRLGIVLIIFFIGMKLLSHNSPMNRAVMIDDLRATAVQIRDKVESKRSLTPPDLKTMVATGMISKSLLEQCEEEKVVYHPENFGKLEGYPIFTIPGKNGERSTVVTAAGLTIRR